MHHESHANARTLGDLGQCLNKRSDYLAGVLAELAERLIGPSPQCDGVGPRPNGHCLGDLLSEADTRLGLCIGKAEVLLNSVGGPDPRKPSPGLPPASSKGFCASAPNTPPPDAHFDARLNYPMRAPIGGAP